MTPRNAAIVACQIIELIPASKPTFKSELESFLRDGLAYRSPELLSDRATWMEFEIIMKKHIRDIREPWEKSVIDIYVGNEILMQ
jgi:hypothetical protein